MVLENWLFETTDDGRPKLPRDDRWEYPESLYPTGQVLTEFDADDVQGVEQILKAGHIRGGAIEKVHRAEGGEAIEVVYWNDEHDPGRHGPSVLSNHVLGGIRKELHEFLPENWRVHRKDNGTRKNRDYPVEEGKSLQKLMIRRVSAIRFRYEDDSEFEYREMLGELPDGLPDDAKDWRDVYPAPPPAYEPAADLYVYETSTGTKHLLQGSVRPGIQKGFRNKRVYEPVSCYCGFLLNPQTLADGEVTHFGEYLLDEDRDSYKIDPKSVFGDDLCTSCWRSYGATATDSDGDVINVEPPTRARNYREIRDWRANP